MTLVVNGEPIEDVVIEQEAESLRVRFQQLSAEEREASGLDGREMEKRAKEWARENVIERTLLRQEALKDTEPIPEEVMVTALQGIQKRYGGEEKFQEIHGASEAIRGEVETRVRVDRLIGKITATVSLPKKKDIAEFYRKNRDRFRAPEMIRASHVVKHVDQKTDEEAALEVMRKARAELDSGCGFGEVADRYSDCSGNGGDLGYFPRAQMVEEFDEVVFSLGIGEVSPVFRTTFGFHIAKVHDKKAARVETLSEVQEKISDELHRRKQTETLEKYVDRLRAGAKLQDIVSAAISHSGS